jgi:hypothetical protein
VPRLPRHGLDSRRGAQTAAYALPGLLCALRRHRQAQEARAARRVPQLPRDRRRADQRQAYSSGAMQSEDGALVRFAITSRRVAKVRELSPVLAEALAAYYGDEGQRCALGEPSGRLYALRRLTAEGRRNPHSNDATEQAAALYGRAAKAWNRQAKGKRQLDREKAKLQQLAGSLTRLGYLDLGSAVGKIVTT